MESTKPKNKTRNLIITVCAAVVVVVVALVVFMNVNTQRIIDQNTQYLETSTNQTVRRVNDTFSSSLQSVQTAAVVYGDAISDEGFNPRTAATILDNAQFDHTFFIDAQGTAHNNDGSTADATDREYYIEGVQGKSGMCYVDSTIFDGQNAVVFYAPVVLDNEVIGIMASVLREESLTEVMTTEFYGQSTPTYLCERDGTMVAMAGSVKPDARDIDEILIAGLTKNSLQCSMLISQKATRSASRMTLPKARAIRSSRNFPISIGCSCVRSPQASPMKCSFVQTRRASS